MLTKKDIKLSGVYGKKIIESIDLLLVKKDENTWHYKRGKLNFFYYPRKKSIYISGFESEKIYNQLLEKINNYLNSLVNMVQDEMAKDYLNAFLENTISIMNEYHIFNVEVLTTLALKRIERFNYAYAYATANRHYCMSCYQELMLYTMSSNNDELVKEIYSKIIEEHSEVKKEKIWEYYYDGMSEDEKILIKTNMDKIKI